MLQLIKYLAMWLTWKTTSPVCYRHGKYARVDAYKSGCESINELLPAWLIY